MVTRFTCIGVVSKIDIPHTSKNNGQESIVLSLDVGGATSEIFPILLTSKILSLVTEDKLRVGDRVYVEGKLKRDRIVTLEPPKMVAVMFANFVSIIS